MPDYRSIFLSLFLFALSGPALRAGNPPHGHELPQDSRIRFVENQGQWDEPGHLRADLPGGRVWLESDRLTYAFYDNHDLHDRFYHRPEGRDKPLPVNGHAFKVIFENANPNVRVRGRERYEEYHNYFLGNDPARWRGEVPLYHEVIYEDLWEGIDLVFAERDGSVKYEFHVDQDADPRQIRMRYEGQDGLEILPGGKLRLTTSVNTLEEAAPVAWFAAESDWQTQLSPVGATFKLEGNVLSYALDQEEMKGPLVIDPTLIFASFTGSTADNFGYTATYDDAGNLYAGGVAFGTGYPIFGGPFQANFGGGGAGGAWTMNGGVDISISKFNPTGTAFVYSTYLGGSANEQPHSLVTNAAGELFVYGRTYSSNYPVSGTAFDNSYNGGGDIVVTHFNAAGTGLVGSTYVGGAGLDGGNIHTAFFQNSLYYNYGDDARGEIIVDANSNIYVASCTQSVGFPTQNPFQAAFGGGTQDACVFRLSPDCSAMNWGSFLGGSGNDAAYGVKLDASGNAFVTGGTASANFPTTAGVVQPAYGGAIDGFISQISAGGNNLLRSTFIGTTGYDQSYFIEIDQNQDIYVVGQSLGGFPVTAGVYNNAGSKQFIAKLDNQLTAYDWSTVFGSGSANINISPTAFLVDICGFVYVSGWGGAVNYTGNVIGMPVTADAEQLNTDATGSDIYLAVFQPDMAGLEYATFLGGPASAEHVDGGTSRFNPNLEVYHAVCAGCGGNSDFPVTPGVVGPTNNASNNNCNLAAFKFAFTPQIVTGNFTAVALDSCAPFPVNFTNTSSGALSYLWDFGDGSPTDTVTNPYHVYSNPGTYVVTLIAVDSNSCNISDTVVNTITVHANPISTVSGSDTICAGTSVVLNATGGSSYLWSPSVSLTNPTSATPTATPTVNTTYQVIVTDSNGCVDTNYVDIAVSNIQADAGPPTAFCEGTGGAQLQAGAVNSFSPPFYYTWWCDSTNTYCGLDSVNDNDPIALPTGTTWYYLQVQDSRGCLSEVDSVLVTVNPIPIANAGPDIIICGDSAPGSNLQGSFSGPPVISYYWYPGTGLSDSTILNPYARPDTTTIYTLVGVSIDGCESEPLDTVATATVFVNPIPVADAGPDKTICFGDSIMLQGIGYAAGPLYDYEWTPANSLSDSTLPNPIANPSLTTDYTLVVWSNGCPSYGDTVTITVNQLPTISPGWIEEICLGDTALLDPQVDDSTAIFEWWPQTGVIGTTADGDLLTAPDSTTVYYMQAVSGEGCRSALDSVTVYLKPTPIAEAGPPLTLCEGDSITLMGSYFYTTTDSAPNPSLVYYGWFPAGDLNDSTQAQPMAWPTSSGYYYLEVRHNTCRTLDSTFVTVNPEVFATAVADTGVICGGDSVQLNASGGLGGASFTWIPANGLSNPMVADPMAAPDSSGTYYVIVEEGGCVDTAAVNIEVIPTPKADYLSSLPQGCVPLTVNFLQTATNGMYYVWDFGDGSPTVNESNPTHIFEAPGTYTVTLVAVNTGGCSDTIRSLNVQVADTVHADFTSDPLTPVELTIPGSEVHFQDLTVGAFSHLWDFGDGSSSDLIDPAHFYTMPGTYMVTLEVTNAHGCVSHVTKGPIVIVEPGLFIPNVFTPNGAPPNDIFQVNYTGNQPFTMQIYTRWGNLVFETNNKNGYWDGTYQGKAMPEGVYFYHIAVGDKDYAGDVTLLR